MRDISENEQLHFMCSGYLIKRHNKYEFVYIQKYVRL